MADNTIHLKKSENPYYVSATQFTIKAYGGQTVQWIADDAKFTVTMLNADKFFDGAPPKLEFTLDSQGTTTSDTYTIKNLLLGNGQEYTIYCVTEERTGDSPPRIIIVPH